MTRGVSCREAIAETPDKGGNEAGGVHRQLYKVSKAGETRSNRYRAEKA